MNTVYYYMVILSCIFHRWLATTQRDFCGFILMVNLYCSHGVYPDKCQFEDGNLMDKITMKSLKFTSLTKSHVYDFYQMVVCII